MYAANDTFDDGRDEDTFQNNVVTNKSKDKQVLKTCLKSKDIEQTLCYIVEYEYDFWKDIFQKYFSHHIYRYLQELFKRTI